LLTQINDLQKSREILNETIAEINKVAIQKFTTTFEQVKVNFKNLFKVLFGEEAEADLALDGDSALDSDVIITAKPPFKKPASIDSLSAGEKTLTAIALLFSIYLVKPSPFCILDEVDAPLDDSNIDKFINLIKRFSKDKQIQFILITHNKKTMEAADLLYGLTMEEEGVTKIVSVKLEK
jgi:chromosome segregation protein